MKNKNFYNVVNKTKLLKVFENNKVMYETYFVVKKPGPGPGPGPGPEPEIEQFITNEYYADKTTRLNDLIANIDVEGIRPPAFMNYSYSTYQLPEGQTEYLNGRFEKPLHSIEAKGFTVEFTLKKPAEVVVFVGSPSNNKNVEAAIINSNNEFIPAPQYNNPGLTEIQPGLYELPNTTVSLNYPINYNLPAGTYRLGTPCQTLTQGLRIYGITASYEGV